MARAYNKVRDGRKICGECRRDLPVEHFHRNGKTGAYRPLCRECRQAHRRGDETELAPGRSYKRARYQRDRALIDQRNDQWRQANPERVREIQRASQRRSRQERPERYRAIGRAQARRRLLGRDDLAVEFATVLLCDPCSYCGAPADHVDHIDALALGGMNGWENLTAACRRCNSSKRHTRLLFWLAR